MASGGYLELDSVDGTVIRTVNAGYGVQPWFAACFEPGRGVEIDDFASIDALWPLVIGKQASFRARRQELQWEETLRVVRRETVTVRAGTFDTWVIQHEDKGVAHDYHAVEECSYAPELGFTVKKTRRVLSGTSNYRPWEVQRIEKRDRSKGLDFVAPPIGTKFILSTNNTFEVTGVEGQSILVTNNFYGGRPDRTLYGGIFVFGTGDQGSSEARKFEALWPLEIGKEISVQLSDSGFQSSGGVWAHTISVDRTELVDTPAGKFFAYVITQKARGLRGGSRVVWTWWWAPAVNFVVKSTFTSLVELTETPLRWHDFTLRQVVRPMGGDPAAR
ncbi:MAG: hypothetical protein JO128_24655, partial [Alphaproteobacteria bacterium]|nr:hypothetical protein [Alphaproteobacteria bacterium]